MENVSIRPEVGKEPETVIDNFVDGIIDQIGDMNGDINILERQHFRLYTYGGKIWHVPKNFSFPTNTKLLT